MLLESLRKVYCRHKSHQFLVLVSLTANMKFVQKQVPNAYLRPLRNDRWEHQGIIMYSIVGRFVWNFIAKKSLA